MTVFKLISAGISACGGGFILYSLNNYNFDHFKVNASWTTNFNPTTKWDSNWDRRDPSSVVKPPKGDEASARFSSELENAKPTAKRHIFLIRHGQYNLSGKTDTERILTKLGTEQAFLTGKRLQEFGHKYTHLIVSTMTRAKETAALIQESLPNNLKVIHCPLLEEGAPIPPEPPLGDYRPEACQFFEDGARIEAAFRRHIHRADPRQKEDSYEIIVCHANVIRYFICRALQVPSEAWLRMSLHHASITAMTILPSGRVVLRTVSDSGHLPAQLVTTS
uniref:Serine/threonine-protein phosphatase PGAM5, mitochondrial n=1 Tax=Homalodisca liturata TaxID=320908 RepID=A0A1B6J4Q5_9HEMI